MRGKLDKGVKDASDHCKSSKCKKAISDLNKANKIKGIAVKLWNEIKNNNEKLDQLYKEIMDAADNFNKWDSRLQQIQDLLLPMLFQVEDNVITIIAAIGNKTQVELDIAAWNVQTTMGSR